MYMVMYVSKDVEQAEAVLKVWVNAGIEGVTILESAGMQQLKKQGIRSDLGLVVSLAALMRATEIHHRTLFSAIKDEAMLNKVVKATEEFVEDWSRPDVGVLLVLPLLQAYGLDKKST